MRAVRWLAVLPFPAMLVGPFFLNRVSPPLNLDFLAGRGRQMNLEQWTAAGRAFGARPMFLLMAGEIYATFTFLGGSAASPTARVGRPPTSSATVPSIT
jgi:hypothetical protein